MQFDPNLYLAAIPAVLLAGLSKGGFGSAFGMLSTPILAMAISPVQAAAIMLPVLLVGDVLGLVSYRGSVKWSIIAQMLPGAMVGVALGWATAAWVNDDFIRLLVGLIALSFGVHQFISDRLAREPAAESAPKAAFWGIFAGYTSFVSHAGGPPFQAYVLPLKLNPMLNAGSTIVFFSVVNAVKVVPYFALGQFGAENLWISASLLIPAILGVVLGIWLVRRVSQALFYNVAYLALVLVGAKLIYDAAYAFA